MIFNILKKKIINQILKKNNLKIIFFDIGSGGKLKNPWVNFHSNNLSRVNADPLEQKEGNLICFSNSNKKNTNFYVANDERGSSLHRPNNEYIEIYDDFGIKTKKIIKVDTQKLDDLYFEKKQIDAIDINTEGHDYYVLDGAKKILGNFPVKLIKIEFEIIKVWEGQKFFSDIDNFLRDLDGCIYDIIKIELDYKKNIFSNKFYFPGDLVWGKAYYIPNLISLKKKLYSLSHSDAKFYITKLICLVLSINQPGYALNILNQFKDLIDEKQKKILEKKINLMFIFYPLSSINIISQYFEKFIKKIFRFKDE